MIANNEILHGSVSHNESEYTELRLDTPLAPPRSREDCAAMKPGTCVKSYSPAIKAAVGEGSLRQLPTCGIMQKNTPRECIVVGHGAFDLPWERFIWRGDRAALRLMWEVD